LKKIGRKEKREKEKEKKERQAHNLIPSTTVIPSTGPYFIAPGASNSWPCREIYATGKL
jgi:hypothetical protein